MTKDTLERLAEIKRLHREVISTQGKSSASEEIEWLMDQLEQVLKENAELVAFVESVAIYDLPSEESKTNHMVAWCSMGAAARECLSKVKTK